MSILKVARMGHPVLRKPARKVEPAEIKTPAFQKLVDDMIETMREYDGIGLAAPQVHESVRLALIGIDEGEGKNRNIRVLPVVNPEVTPTLEDDRRGLGRLPQPPEAARPRRPSRQGPGARARPSRQPRGVRPRRLLRPAWRSTRSTISTASCSSTG